MHKDTKNLNELIVKYISEAMDFIKNTPFNKKNKNNKNNDSD